MKFDCVNVMISAKFLCFHMADIMDKLFQRIHLDNASSQSDEEKKWRA